MYILYDPTTFGALRRVFAQQVRARSRPARSGKQAADADDKDDDPKQMCIERNFSMRACGLEQTRPAFKHLARARSRKQNARITRHTMRTLYCTMMGSISGGAAQLRSSFGSAKRT